MIKLMHVNDYVIDTSKFSPLLNDKVVEELENKIANFVGAKYACSIHSATMAIFLSLLEKERQTITIPSIIPPVVPNAVLTSGHDISYKDDVNWVGHSYILHDFGDYKIIDSAQQLDRNQFKDQANDQDLMIFSFYPTKPVGSIDGGMVVSNDIEKINRIKTLSRYGTNFEDNSWERKFVLPGWKMYMNSVQAHIALQNFHKLDGKTNRYDEIREIYNSEFGLNNTSRHLYRIRVKDRESFIASMKDKGIQCGIHYKSVHNIECYKSKTNISLPLSERESEVTVSIPFHEKLEDKEIEIIMKETKNAQAFWR
jgi:dTDP-4-amino-4,6-dideoxygalactose transaminase